VIKKAANLPTLQGQISMQRTKRYVTTMGSVSALSGAFLAVSKKLVEEAETLQKRTEYGNRDQG
jgi:hypothetical protein